MRLAVGRFLFSFVAAFLVTNAASIVVVFFVTIAIELLSSVPEPDWLILPWLGWYLIPVVCIVVSLVWAAVRAAAPERPTHLLGGRTAARLGKLAREQPHSSALDSHPRF
jgi:hypothetical protein